MFERFTLAARRSVFFARDEASRFASGYIEVEHLLIGILSGDPDLAARLQPAGITQDSIRARMEPAIREVATPLDMPLSAASKRALALAAEESKTAIRAEHLLVGVVQQESSLAAQILLQAGLTAAKLREFAPAVVVDADEVMNRLAAAIPMMGNEWWIASLAAYIARSSDEEIEALIAAIRAAKQF